MKKAVPFGLFLWGAACPACPPPSDWLAWSECPALDQSAVAHEEGFETNMVCIVGGVALTPRMAEALRHICGVSWLPLDWVLGGAVNPRILSHPPADSPRQDGAPSARLRTGHLAIYPCFHPPICLSMQPPTHPSTHTPTHSSTHSSTHPVIHHLLVICV